MTIPPFRIDAHPAEPAYGLVERLAASARTTPRRFAEEWGLCWKSVARGQLHEEIARLARVAAGPLRAATPERKRVAGRSVDLVTFRGQGYPSSAWMRTDRRCPACAAEDLDRTTDSRLRRRFWVEIRTFSRCPVHGHRLVEGRTWSGEPRAVICGSIPFELTAPTDADAWAWERYALDHLDGTERERIPLLDGLAFPDVLGAVLALGQVTTAQPSPHARNADIGFRMARAGASGIASAVSSAARTISTRTDAEAASGWRNRLRQVLGWLRETCDGPGALGIRVATLDAIAAHVPDRMRSDLPDERGTSVAECAPPTGSSD